MTSPLMHKADIIRFHAILYQLRFVLEATGPVGTAFQAYDAQPIRPSNVGVAGPGHRLAVYLLAEALSLVAVERHSDLLHHAHRFSPPQKERL